jgi:hypothetical protein
MAVGDSKVSIINNVLEPMGVKPILTLSHVNARTARANQLWDQARKECLAAWPWGFADARMQLTQLVSAPSHEFLTYWQWPMGALKVSDLYPDEAYLRPYNRNKWRREYDRVTAQSVIAAAVPAGSKAYARYTIDVEDVTVWTPDFISAFKHLLASRFAIPFRQDKSMAQQEMQLYKMEIEEGKMSDTYEGDPTGLHESRETEMPIELIAVRYR